MLYKKEKAVNELILKHLRWVDDCLKLALNTVREYLSGNIEEAKSLALKVDKCETETDEILREIMSKLYSGAYLPSLRSDILHLVQHLDGLANAAEACCDFFLDQRPDIPEELKPQFFRVTHESFGILGPLKEAMLSYFGEGGKVKAIREKAKQVGVKESDVDKIEWDLTRQIFTSSLDWGHKVHLRLCLA